jgi:aspartate/methionine/tyrosine aminotransferase
MKDVISLGIGEPDFVTPPHIIRAGVESLGRGETHYTSNPGTSSCAVHFLPTSPDSTASSTTPIPSC